MPTFIDGVSSHKAAYTWIEMCFAALELHSAAPTARICDQMQQFMHLNFINPGHIHQVWTGLLSGSVGHPGQQ